MKHVCMEKMSHQMCLFVSFVIRYNICCEISHFGTSPLLQVYNAHSQLKEHVDVVHEYVYTYRLSIFNVNLLS